MVRTWQGADLVLRADAVHKEAVAQRCSVKKGVLRNFAKFSVLVPQSLF